MPDDFLGFLDDLSNRPDEVGEVDIIRLSKIVSGNYLVIVVFDVRSNITNQEFTFEYASWKTGKNPGSRGIIFLETDGKITHFLLSKSHKFSSMEEVYDSIGGLYFHPLEKNTQNLPKKIDQEIRFHLGIDHVEFKKVISLGKAHPDYGMSNNQTDLFAATIDISNVPNLTTKKDFRATHKPVGFEIKIIHISEFGKYLNLIEDNYFLSAAARILTRKDISLEF